MLTESEMETGGGGGGRRGEELCSIKSVETVVRRRGEGEREGNPPHLTYCKAVLQLGSTSELTNGCAAANVEEEMLKSHVTEVSQPCSPRHINTHGFDMQAA